MQLQSVLFFWYVIDHLAHTEFVYTQTLLRGRVFVLVIWLHFFPGFDSCLVSLKKNKCFFFFFYNNVCCNKMLLKKTYHGNDTD